MTTSIVSKRKRRRDKGKLKQQRYVFVHYYLYYGTYEYLPAALEFFDPDRARSVKYRSDLDKTNHMRPSRPELKTWYNRWVNKRVFEKTVQVASYEDAKVHIIERKLRMLDSDTGFAPWSIYEFVPWKITEQTGKGKYAKVHRQTLLGTR